MNPVGMPGVKSQKHILLSSSKEQTSRVRNLGRAGENKKQGRNKSRNLKTIAANGIGCPECIFIGRVAQE